MPNKARVTDALHLASEDVSDAEIRLWLWYRKHHIGERGAYISDPATAGALGWSERKVQHVRAALDSHGLLRIVRRGPKPPAYYPLPPVRDSQTTASHGSQPITSQQPKDSQHDSQNIAPTIKELEPSRTLYTPEFEEFWKTYPRRNGQSKRRAFRAWNARLREGLKPQVMIDGARRYAAYRDGEDPKYTKHAATFLGPDHHFLETWERFGANSGRSAGDYFMEPAVLRKGPAEDD